MSKRNPRHPPRTTRRPTFHVDPLEPRTLLNAAFDVIRLTDARSDRTFRGIDGTGVSVAVIDTGLDSTHPALSGNYVAGYDFYYGRPTPTPTASHGTHVAGIVGSTDPEIGVAPNVGLIGLQVFNPGGEGASYTTIESALQWVLDNRTRYNIVAVNMSLGSGFYTAAGQAASEITYDEVQRLEAAGVTVVSAAGNSYKGHEYRNSGSPGIYSTLDVGAVWQDGNFTNIQWGSGAIDYTTGPDRVTSFSQRPNTSNLIFAPGALIHSTVPGGKYDDMGGTSMASPMVAGVVALMQQAAFRFGGRYLTPAEVRSVMQSTADSVYDGDDENDNVANTNASYPRLNAHRALTQIYTMFQGNNPAPDPGTSFDANGTIDGAFRGPTLDGAPVDPVRGSIGYDGGTTLVGDKDVDLIRFDVVSPGTVTLDLNSTGGTDFDTFLRVFDSRGRVVGYNDDKSPRSAYSAIALALGAGTYYAGVSGFNNSGYDPTVAGSGVAGATGDYSLSFTLANSDYNGLFASATAVNVSANSSAEPPTFQGFIGADYGKTVGTSDVDMFKVVVPDNGTLWIDIDTPDADYVDSYLRVFDQDGNELAASDDDRPASDTQGHATDSFVYGNVQRGQVYYVGVSDVANYRYDPTALGGRSAAGAGGLYNLTLTLDSPDADGAIWKVQQGGLTALGFTRRAGTIGTDVNPSNGSAVTVGDKDVDFFHIRPDSAGLLELDVTAYRDKAAVGNDPVDAVLSLFDADGKLVGAIDDADGSVDPVLLVRVEGGADYYVAVSGTGNVGFDPFALASGASGDTGRYLLSARMRPTADAARLGDDSVTGTVDRIAVGGRVAGIIGSDGALEQDSTDVDLYQLDATEDQVVEIRAAATDEFGANTFLRLFNSRGSELAWNDDVSAASTDSVLRFRVRAGRTYFIGVNGSGRWPRYYDPSTGAGARGGATGTYMLSVSEFKGFVATGTDAGVTGRLVVRDAVSGDTAFEVVPFGKKFKGGVRVAVGDVNGDGVPDAVAGAGPGARSVVAVYSGVDGSLLRSFRAYSKTFTGGIFVAAGDVNGDGRADIVTGPSTGAKSELKVFSGADSSVLYDFLVFGRRYAGGMSVAAGDVNGDGRADMIAAIQQGAGGARVGPPTVAVYSGADGSVLHSFRAYEKTFLGGVSVSAGDVNGDGLADIITAPGAGIAGTVRAFSGADLALLREFVPYRATFKGGVRVAALDVSGDGKADYVTAPAAGGYSSLRVFNATSLALVDAYNAEADTYNVGLFLAAGR